jgi:hypothetical protein
MVSYPCGPPSSLDTGMSMVFYGIALGVSGVQLARQGRGRDVESRKRAFLETSTRLGKDPALILRADSTAPVFNDEEKRARATTQVHKVAREGYRCDVGGLAFWARCDRATTLFAGLGMLGSSAYCSRESCGFRGSGVTWRISSGLSLSTLQTCLQGQQ